MWTSLLLTQAVVTGATAATLVVAPRVIPSAFGLTRTPDAFLRCDRYAATEATLTFGSLSVWRADDVRTVRLLCLYVAVVHTVVVAALFTRAAPRRAPAHGSPRIEDSEMPEPLANGLRMRDKKFLVIGATGHVGPRSPTGSPSGGRGSNLGRERHHAAEDG